jgi:hypothetical protein
MLAVAALALALGGCASGPAEEDVAAPATALDRAPRPAGELRRILLLPVVFEPGECRWSDAAARLDASAVLFLQDWKGYAVQRAAPGDAAVARRAGALAAWQAENPDGGTLPPPLQRDVDELAGASTAEGVLVIHATPRCGGYTTQALQAVARAVPDSIGGAPVHTLSATLLDAARGATAWQRQITPKAWADPPPAGPSPFDMRRAAEELFHPIENALPAVLERPRRVTPSTP